MPAESNEVGLALLHDLLSACGIEAPGCDHRPSEQRTKQAGRYRRFAVVRHIARDARLDNVQVGQPEAGKFASNIGKGYVRRAVTHATELVTWTDANADPIASPHRFHRLDDFQ